MRAWHEPCYVAYRAKTVLRTHWLVMCHARLYSITVTFDCTCTQTVPCDSYVYIKDGHVTTQRVKGQSAASPYMNKYALNSMSWETAHTVHGSSSFAKLHSLTSIWWVSKTEEVVRGNCMRSCIDWLGAMQDKCYMTWNSLGRRLWAVCLFVFLFQQSRPLLLH